MKKNIVALAVAFLILSGLLPAQESLEDKLAGLEKKLQSSSKTERVDLLNEIAGAYRFSAPKKCIQYGKQAAALSIKLHYPEGEAQAYNHMGIADAILRNSKNSLKIFQKALDIYENLDNKKGIAKILNNMGNVYRHINNSEKALEVLEKALKIEREYGSPHGLALALGNIGNIYSNLNDFHTALDYDLQSLKIKEELGDKNEIAVARHNIGNIYLNLNQPEKALEFFLPSLKVARDAGNKKAAADCLNCIGVAYRDLKKYDLAQDCFQNALTLAEELGDKMNLAYAYGNMATIFRNLKEYDKALTFYRKANKINVEIGDKWGIAGTLSVFGLLYSKKGRYDKAAQFLEKGLKLAKEIKAKDIVAQAYAWYSELYAAKGDYKKALKYFKLFQKTDKEVYNESSSRQLNQLQARYQSQKKAKEIDALKKNKKIQQLTLSRTRVIRNTWIAGFAMVTIFLLLLFKKYLHLFAFWKKQKYIGQFRLTDKIGSGAMGYVHKAHSIVNKSDIAAVKILRDELFTDEKLKKRFNREAALIDKLDHPNIVRIIGRGESNQTLFIAMEFLEGKTLESRIIETGQFPLDAALHIMKQITEAIAYIHFKGIMHRDLKPANIMLIEKEGDTDFVKLLDFGLAKMEFQTRLTQSGTFVGTIEYIAPEEVMGEKSSLAGDIFSLGVVFYRMLCGVVPFQGETVIEIMRSLIGTIPAEVSQTRRDVPEVLNGLVNKMLDKDPAQRPQAKEVLEKLGIGKKNTSSIRHQHPACTQ
ncbi:MAG: tetratricopeptide repeat protein [bacterium]|nr:tetratricopeptide repeat protein [bacterium]